ncbi:MAG: DnaJ domain-containing protein [Candidatus Rokuibacteriota bacterium]
MRRDYYAVLGVVSTAEPREVRQAYRRLARQYSPDVNFWDAQARALFEEIAEAYRVLSDPAARAMYDRFGADVARGDALPAGRRGEDLHVSVELDFARVVCGARVRFDAPRFSPCARCAASGHAARAPCAGVL